MKRNVISGVANISAMLWVFSCGGAAEVQTRHLLDQLRLRQSEPKALWILELMLLAALHRDSYGYRMLDREL
jgi:hypothetical protein